MTQTKEKSHGFTVIVHKPMTTAEKELTRLYNQLAAFCAGHLPIKDAITA